MASFDDLMRKGMLNLNLAEDGVFTNYFTKLVDVRFDRRLRTHDFADLRSSFVIVWEQSLTHRWPLPEPTAPKFPTKSVECALGQSKAGCSALKKGNLSEALKYFNLSVMRCPQPTIVEPEDDQTPLSPELSEIYAQRARVLFRLKKYHECISDIHQALYFDYPLEKEFEMFELQGCCCEQLNEFEKAVGSFREAFDICENRDTDAKRIEKLLQSAEKKLNSAKLPKSLLNTDYDPCPKIPKLSYGVSQESESVSISVRKADSVFGYVAARDIAPGDVLFLEEPYIYQMEIGTLSCGGCGREVAVVWPCRGCALELYCGQQCEQRAWEQFHSLECDALPRLMTFMDFVMSENLNYFLLTARILLKLVSQFMAKSGKQSEDPASDAEFRKVGVHSGSSDGAGNGNGAEIGAADERDGALPYDELRQLDHDVNKLFAKDRSAIVAIIRSYDGVDPNKIDIAFLETLWPATQRKLAKYVAMLHRKNRTQSSDGDEDIHDENSVIGELFKRPIADGIPGCNTVKIAARVALILRVLNETSLLKVVRSDRGTMKLIASHLRAMFSASFTCQSRTTNKLQKLSAAEDSERDFDVTCGVVMTHIFLSLFLQGRKMAKVIPTVHTKKIADAKRRGQIDLFMATLDLKSKIHGYAYYPTIDLIDHSCFPNVTEIYYGTTCVVRAVRTIKAGEAVRTALQYSHPHTEYRERQEMLKRRYGLDCRCPPCTDRIAFDELSHQMAIFKCPHCQQPINTSKSTAAACRKCGRLITKARKAFTKQWQQFASASIDGLRSRAESVTDEEMKLFGEIEAMTVDHHRSMAIVTFVDVLVAKFQIESQRNAAANAAESDEK